MPIQKKLKTKVLFSFYLLVQDLLEGVNIDKIKQDEIKYKAENK